MSIPTFGSTHGPALSSSIQSPSLMQSRSGIGLNLLSLDGGGVRGLSALYILKQLMESVNFDKPPKPCEYFDMIGGTSTGGLIAIMLGRLDMTVDECIDAYRAMSPAIFTKVRHRLGLKGKVQGRFDHTALEESVKNILKERGLPGDQLLYQTRTSASTTNACKTFVCATSKQTGKTVVFSSYPSERRGRDLLGKATIWQAARATSAATSFFNPIEIGNEEFVDGATPANNPITELWSEAYDVFSNREPTWSLEDNLACIVSIGTGVPTIRPFGDDPLQIGAKLVKMATDTERAADEFCRHHPRLVLEGRYYRFNVRSGLEGVGLEEESKFKEIISATRLYIQTDEVYKLMMACADAVSRKRALTRNYYYAMEQSRRPEIMALHRNSDILASTFDITPSSDVIGWFTNTADYRLWESMRGCLYYPITSATAHGLGKYLVGALPALWKRHPPPYWTSSGSHVIPEVWVAFANCENIPHGAVSDLIRLLVAQVLVRLCPTEDVWSTVHQGVTLHERRIISKDWSTAPLSALFNALNLLLATAGRNHEASLRVLFTVTNVHLLEVGFIEGEMTQLRAELERMGLHVLLTGKERLVTSSLTWGARSFLKVDEDTEYQEFLSVLEFDDMHTRRNQVAAAFGGTTNWIETHPAFEEWNQESSGILWIQGKPGSGKSVLAKSILDLVQKSAPTGLLIVSWFYSKRGGETGMSHTSMMRSVCYQLLTQCKTLFSACAHIYRRQVSVFDLLPEVLEAVFTSPDGPPILCLLDGLDESANRDEEGGRNMLQKLAELTDRPGSRVKVIVLSRPYSSIEEIYGTYDILLEAENGDDIAKIVDQGINSLAQAMDKERPAVLSSFANKRRQKFEIRQPIQATRPPGGDIDEAARQGEILAIKKYLIDHAQGVTLWVTLSIDQAVRFTRKGPCSWTTIRRMLASLPLGVNKMYNLITAEVAQDCDPEHIHMARKVLAWVITASTKRPLLVKELFDALSIPDDPLISRGWCGTNDPVTSNRPICDSWADFCRSIFDICGPLVEFVNAPSRRGMFQYDRMTNVTERSVVQLVHQTAKDFLESVQDNVFAFKPGEAQQIMEDAGNLYLDLVIPLRETSYAAVLDDVSADWRKRVIDLVEYLDDKYLLPFILAHCPISDEYRSTATSPRDSGWMLSAFFYDMSYRDMDVEGVLEQTVVGSCFLIACKRGLQTAIDNLLYLTSLSPFWWRTHREAVLTAAWRVAKSQELRGLARELREDRRQSFNKPAIRHGNYVDSPDVLLRASRRSRRPRSVIGSGDIGGHSPSGPSFQAAFRKHEPFPNVRAGERPMVRQSIERIMHYLTGNMQPLDLKAGVTWEIETSPWETGGELRSETEVLVGRGGANATESDLSRTLSAASTLVGEGT